MRVAILSFAHERAETYARLLSARPDVELVAADPGGSPADRERDRGAADRLGVSYVDDWAALAGLRPGAVVVTGPIGRRRELVEWAAGVRAQVLCEYPPAVGEADLKAMVDACDSGGVRLTLASPACHSGAFAAVRRGIADGIVGTLTTVLGSCHSRPGSGAALAVNAPHLLDLVDVALGGEPAQEVYAQTNTVLSGRTEAESGAVLTVRYRGGLVASFDCSQQPAATGVPFATFIGDRASVDYDPAPRLLGGFDVALGGDRVEPGGGDLHALLLNDFLSAAESGTGSGPDGGAGLRTLRIVRAAYESARTGQPVRLPDSPGN
ncbi:Gfo/Idh/MocA family oxidoreductase [Amycolatopsis sp. PS_44_ISF1]|uniref:Gfo/Idh/MocA family protein n=1 Tax=Amycolatopsis sp. PS_44_ISF1 TaxID=2974917 RepID=UPI0028DEC767|nr:Gfo/Idh/MocA family oxidoreductase [Amycolatopsis sp. PS_44_ISF1]MDT8909788.1 Gfo/Idh/MocA family oxidoreductase [Amycolatopsis sp. PS_44_ISF1]